MSSIFHRTSIRKYQETPVEQEKVEQLMRAAMAAPSAGNQQPWEFYVITNKEMIQKLSDCSPYAGCLAKAPLCFVPCYRLTNVKNLDYVQIDLSASVENLLLQVDELGLGAVWMGVAPERDRMDAVKEIVGMPENLDPFAMIACGYPAEEKVQQDRYEEERVHYIL